MPKHILLDVIHFNPIPHALQGTKKKNSLSAVLVRMVRVELTRANAHYPLKVACLPFHHIRFGTAKINQVFESAKFFSFFSIIICTFAVPHELGV